ncbi:pyridoxal-phosphate dependent enzyme [Candidatus Saccharibacteria bacterium]|nr:pyridoxal-phosphate dependent enzyme [Candidatus Saccharibacteria bacterium]
MTIVSERLLPSTTHGDEALDIVNGFRADLHDDTYVEQLDREFPSYADYLGAYGVALMNLSDNDAGAFKWRGAAVGAAKLKEQGVQSIVAPSAGNHARGAAAAAKLLDMHLAVVVPSSAPPAKRDYIHGLSNSQHLQVQVVGATFDESLAWAQTLPGAMLHPYNNSDVIAGQGTIVDDLLATQPDTQHIVLPVGGGGLLAGVLRRLDELQRTDITVHAAQATGSNSLGNSLTARELTAAHNPNQRYGGSAVQTIGPLALRQCLSSPNLRLLEVPNEDVDELSELYAEDRKHLLRASTPNYEPTTLVAIAALKQLQHLDSPVTVLGTGQNDTIHPPLARRTYRLPF